MSEHLSFQKYFSVSISIFLISTSLTSKCYHLSLSSWKWFNADSKKRSTKKDERNGGSWWKIFLKKRKENFGKFILSVGDMNIIVLLLIMSQSIENKRVTGKTIIAIFLNYLEEMIRMWFLYCISRRIQKNVIFW